MAFLKKRTPVADAEAALSDLTARRELLQQKLAR
jgi:hypothetical protein